MSEKGAGLVIPCNRCGRTLTAPGALLFGPPASFGMVAKLHLCTPCWLIVEAVVTGRPHEEAS